MNYCKVFFTIDRNIIQYHVNIALNYFLSLPVNMMQLRNPAAFIRFVTILMYQMDPIVSFPIILPTLLNKSIKLI
ncbi:hypothetical protein LINPERPRIM_LOCUS21360, partial [Linum perenne]